MHSTDGTITDSITETITVINLAIRKIGRNLFTICKSVAQLQFPQQNVFISEVNNWYAAWRTIERAAMKLQARYDVRASEIR